MVLPMPRAGDATTPAVVQGGTWGLRGMQVLGEDGAVLLVTVKPSQVWAWQLHGGVFQHANAMVKGRSLLGIRNSG